MIITESDDLKDLIHGCKHGERMSQKQLYEKFFGYSLSVCIRYCKNKEEAYEILNDGFMKVFSKLDLYDQDKPFKGWLRRIMINTALDHYRRNLKHSNHKELTENENFAVFSNALPDLAYDDIVLMIQKLPPAYKLVFNMAVIDGYKHEEIADILGISVGTSKSNLFKAREKLKIMVKQEGRGNYAKSS